MVEKALETIKKYSMFNRGDTVVIGFSGGADSAALLHFLYTHARDYDLNLIPVHLNHCLRGEESLRDELFVRGVCSALGLPVVVRSADIAGMSETAKKSAELFAREVRYELFAEVAEKHSDARIATAHTLSDSMETLIFNLARGTGLKGLTGIPPVRGAVVRPLIECTRAEIEQYCVNNAVKWIKDSTNDTDLYIRNKIRKHIIPRLYELNPVAHKSVMGTIDALRDDENYMAAAAGQAKSGFLSGGRKLPDLISCHSSIRRRVILSLLLDYNVQPTRERILQIEGLAMSGAGGVQLNKDIVARVRGDALCFETAAAPCPGFEVPFREGEISLFTGKSIQIVLCDYEQYNNFNKNNKKLLKNVLDYDKIIGNAIIRQRVGSDRIKLAGRGCTKSLKKLMNEGGIPPARRKRLAVAADQKGVFWVEGFGIDERLRPDAGSKTIGLINVVDESETRCGEIE